jgi:hypothetical protein
MLTSAVDDVTWGDVVAFDDRMAYATLLYCHGSTVGAALEDEDMTRICASREKKFSFLLFFFFFFAFVHPSEMKLSMKHMFRLAAHNEMRMVYILSEAF